MIPISWVFIWIFATLCYTWHKEVNLFTNLPDQFGKHFLFKIIMNPPSLTATFIIYFLKSLLKQYLIKYFFSHFFFHYLCSFYTLLINQLNSMDPSSQNSTSSAFDTINYKIVIGDSTGNNIRINQNSLPFQDHLSDKIAFINGKAFHIIYSTEIPINTCQMSQPTSSFLFGMFGSPSTQITFASSKEADRLQSIEYEVRVNGPNCRREIHISKLRKQFLSELKCFNNKQIFQFDYIQGNNKVKLALTVTSINGSLIQNPQKSWGFLTEQTKIKFKRAQYQKLDLIQENNEDQTTSNSSDNSDHKLLRFTEEIGKKAGGQRKILEIIQTHLNKRVLSPKFIKKMKIRHIKGILLYGPPGTGKTLIARLIAQLLEADQSNITLISGPENMDKHVGQSEKNTKKPYDKARQDYERYGDDSPIHVIIYDEFDAIAAKRKSDSNQAYVSVINTILANIDGLTPLNNILVIGITNRKQLIDEAILRPGRLEVHLEVGLPDQKGRLQILKIHCESYIKNKCFDSSVSLQLLAKLTKNWTGAQLAALCQNSLLHLLSELVRKEQFHEDKIGTEYFLTQSHFMQAFNQITPKFGADTISIEEKNPEDLIAFEKIYPNPAEYFNQITQKIKNMSQGKVTILLSGDKRVGKTVMACFMAKAIDFEFNKIINNDKLIGLDEYGKVAHISETFQDSQKCQSSCIILDNMIDLIQYVPMDGHYNKSILQRFTQFLRKQPEKGKKSIIIVTERDKALLKKLGLYSIFDYKIEVPNLNGQVIETVLSSRGYQEQEIKKVSQCFSRLPIGQVWGLMQSSKNCEGGLEKACKLLKMKQCMEKEEEN